jgi:hypothetical protein
MKNPGKGAHAKGSAFERATGVLLSKWITKGERVDLFSRNVLSGGRFTNALKRDELESAGGSPGDLMAAHPLAFKFLELFLVECKHYKDLGLHQFLMDTRHSSFLGGVLHNTMGQAERANRHWLIIAKQNRVDTIVFIDPFAGMLARQMARPRGHLHYHLLHNGTVCMMRLETFLQKVEPSAYLSQLAEQRNVKT